MLHEELGPLLQSRYQRVNLELRGNKLVIGIHTQAWSCRGTFPEGAVVREKHTTAAQSRKETGS